MKILISGMMGPGTLEAKVVPLTQIEQVEEILFVRKTKGPAFSKVKYVELPKLCKYSGIHLVVHPILLLWLQLKYKSDLIISYHIIPYAFFVSMVGLITKTPYVIAQTGLQIQDKIQKSKILRFILKRTFRYSYRVNCPGTKSVSFWTKYYPDISTKFNVLHSTVDESVYKPNNERPEYDFIFLGRLHQIKNVDLIIKSLGVLYSTYNLKCKLQIVGKGPEFERLIRMTESLNLTEFVSFKGFVNDPVAYLNNSKFLIMTSNSEGLPTAMMQGMACGVIPITNTVGNISDLVVDGETGFTYEHLNEDEIASVMFKVLNEDVGKLALIRENCVQVIRKNHSHKASEKKWIRYLDELKNA